ncbi:MAG: class II aldolase/adducin family protein [Leptolinea sp.]
MSIMYAEVRARIAEIGKLMFDRNLTDTAGGNISVRVGEHVCITPRFAGSKFQWHLRLEQVLVTDFEGNKIEGEGEVSREAKVHYALMRAYPESGSVVHGHAQNVLVFCAANIPMLPVLEDTQKYGVIKVSKYATAHSGGLAENLLVDFADQGARIKSSAAAVMAVYHGLFVLARDLETGFDVTERLDRNARVILQAGSLFPVNVDPAISMSKACAETIAEFKASQPV